MKNLTCAVEAPNLKGISIFLHSPSPIKVTVKVDNPEAAKNTLQNTKWYSQIDSIQDRKINLNIEQEDVPLLNKYLIENGIMVNALVPVRSLEDYFLSITSEAK